MLDKVSGFVTDQVQPAESTLDAGGPQAREALNSLRAEAKARGLWALPLPLEHGGGGLGLADYFALAEAEGRSDHGPAALGSASLLDVRMLTAHASTPVREQYVGALVAGEITGCYAMTEPEVAGSDPTGILTRAERVADGWLVTGRKWFTTGAADAAYCTVLARSPKGLSSFVVPTGSPGFRVVRELPVLGAAGQYEIALEDVLVPRENLLGDEGSGLAIAGGRLALGRTLRCLRWIGQAERAYDLMCDRATSRRLGDGVLADRQLVRQHVFEALLAIRSARALTHRAAALVAEGERARVEIGLAKVAAARTLHQVVDSAVQVFGAEGLTPDTPLPMLARLGRAARILDGADELHVSATARAVLAQRS
ncbi:acyl-CoA dehydrogenase family protein [Umezawaea endophytica]|uniref:Acyl-CoA dehydrogenase family protein n=1 Tax=Umezawaea endophytica TaxID=1654476 RepID=A0A9X2ZXJ8_9PSEU|nr:acyl-CoA dehydrogenase family protein [Umezawaea endophytica]MCS7475424.1 acyl-CoA dehydrogenase family protein [Umezawaea endophytica]